MFGMIGMIDLAGIRSRMKELERLESKLVTATECENNGYGEKGKSSAGENVLVKGVHYNKPVKVYRKLAGKGFRKNGSKLYSIVQGGRVVAVRSRILLRDVKFTVSESGRQRVLKTGCKNVHAFAVGYIASSEFTPKNQISGAMGIDENGSNLPLRVFYNPRRDKFFRSENSPKITGAMAVLFNESGVTAAYTY